MVRRFLFLFLLFVSLSSFGQRNDIKFGIGVQAFEPTGITLQAFRGFYNNNNSSFATYGVVELGVGKENVLGLINDDNKLYAGGNWTKGGLRVDLNYLYPLMTVHAPFVFQVYAGAGLQTGTRNYILARKEESKFATGFNLMVRMELVSNGLKIGKKVWFLSVYGDIKYHDDFTEHFDYVAPVVGLRLRKGR